jgi:hypothetical protein
MGLIPGGPGGLLADDQADRWVRWCFEADAGDGVDPHSHVLELIAVNSLVSCSLSKLNISAAPRIWGLSWPAAGSATSLVMVTSPSVGRD